MLKDLLNQKFTRLLVLERHGYNKKEITWKCLCDCGNIAIVTGRCLRKGDTRSCGCFKKEVSDKANLSHRQPIPDIIGKRFGKLLVLNNTGRRDNFNKIIWECICDCGTPKFTTSDKLVTNTTRSCGCLQREKASERFIAYQRNVKIQNGQDPDVLITGHTKHLRNTHRKNTLVAKKRDGNKCCLCLSTDLLQVHHIIPIIENQELTTDINNMITLCRKCHFIAHNGNTHGEVDLKIQRLLHHILLFS